jgi:hypothetical protein
MDRRYRQSSRDGLDRLMGETTRESKLRMTCLSRAVMWMSSLQAPHRGALCGARLEPTFRPLRYQCNNERRIDAFASKQEAKNEQYSARNRLSRLQNQNGAEGSVLGRGNVTSTT